MFEHVELCAADPAASRRVSATAPAAVGVADRAGFRLAQADAARHSRRAPVWGSAPT